MNIISNPVFLISTTIILLLSPFYIEKLPEFQKLHRGIETIGVKIPKKVGNVYVVNDAEKYDSQSNGGKVKISACASDKYKSLTDLVKEAVQSTYPDVEVIVPTYNAPDARVMAAQFFSGIQGFGFMVTFLGAFLLKSIGVEEVPLYVTWMRKHRLISLLLIWVGGNFLHGLLFGTGAFEVYYDGQLILSKLAGGRLPGVHDVLKELNKRIPKENVVIS